MDERTLSVRQPMENLPLGSGHSLICYPVSEGYFIYDRKLRSYRYHCGFPRTMIVLHFLLNTYTAILMIAVTGHLFWSLPLCDKISVTRNGSHIKCPEVVKYCPYENLSTGPLYQCSLVRCVIEL